MLQYFYALVRSDIGNGKKVLEGVSHLSYRVDFDKVRLRLSAAVYSIYHFVSIAQNYFFCNMKESKIGFKNKKW